MNTGKTKEKRRSKIIAVKTADAKRVRKPKLPKKRILKKKRRKKP